jgi:Fe2+ or Zn2+ uptake regulation protein
LTQLILTYLKENAEAGDTLEGIARWWVMRQNISHSVNQVQQALETLKSMGVIDEWKVSDQETVYFARAQSE